MKELTKADAQKVASLITPLIDVLDMIVQVADIELMKRQFEKMQDQQEYLAAWPFPATLNKADETSHQLKTFGAIINLIEVRKNQIDNKIAGKKFSEGNEILKHLGF